MKGRSGRSRDIIVGVGDQPSAVSATRFAVAEARARRSGVVLARAYPVPVAAPLFTAEAYDELEAASQAVVDDVRAQVEIPDDVPVDTLIECTMPLSLLRRLSETAAMVVLGQDRLPVIDRLLSGSVASPLSAHARCPVAIVPTQNDTTASAERTVIVAVDGETAAEQALRLAFEEAELRHADLVVLHALPLETLPTERASAEVSVAEVIAGRRAEHPDTVVREILLPGEPAEVIAAASHGAGLMIVGHPHEQHLGGWIGSVAHAVLKETSCPLIITPREMPMRPAEQATSAWVGAV